MIAGSNGSILLIGGAIVVTIGLLSAYLLTRSKARRAITRQETVEPPEITDAHPACEHETELSLHPAPTASDAEEHARQHLYSKPITEEPDVDDESSSAELVPDMRDLDSQLKHRIVYRFMPHLKGMLFEGNTLDGYLADAVDRAGNRGWSNDELLAAARTGKWRKPRAAHQ